MLVTWPPLSFGQIAGHQRERGIFQRRKGCTCVGRKTRSIFFCGNQRTKGKLRKGGQNHRFNRNTYIFLLANFVRLFNDTDDDFPIRELIFKRYLSVFYYLD